MSEGARISKREFNEIAAEYGLPRPSVVRDSADPALGQYVLETPRGKFVARLTTIRSEMEAKRELDFLIFLRKHGYPAYVPLADRRGRYQRDWHSLSLAIYRFVDGRELDEATITCNQVEAVGRALAELHLIGKAYKKGIDSRFSFERTIESYRNVRGRLPQYFKKVVRTFDEELEYLQHYLELKLPKGVLFGDLSIEMLRFKGDKIVLVLDCDPGARGKFIFDLANAVNVLCFDDGRYHLERWKAMMTGYETVRTLSLAEWDAFPNELRFSAFRSAVARLNRLFGDHVEERTSMNRQFQEYFERLRILRREREGGMEPMLMAMATGYDYRKYQRVKAYEKRNSR
jgi:homoserine kinase type II